MNILFDLKYAWRLMRKSWGYSLMCASVVALSVGLAVWTHALAYSQLMEPLPFPGSDRWYSVQIGADAASRVRPSVDAYTWQEMLKRRRAADHLGAYSMRAAVLSEGQATTSLRGVAVSPLLLAASRVAPVLGRTFVETDGQSASASVAIISFETWQRYFAADPEIVGKTARIDAAPMQIVGVMPENFYFFDDFEVFMPLQVPNLARPSDSTTIVFPILALRANQELNTVASEITAAVDDVTRGYPRLFKTGRYARLIPAAQMFTHSVTPIIAMMSLMAAGVLLLGCVNISMVFLARLLERSRELALRTALGSSRPRLIRQCLLETALIVLLGLIAGCGLAYMGIEWTHGISDFGARIMASGRSSNLPQLRAVNLLMAVLFAIMVWLLSTLIPALRIARQDASVVLAGSGKGGTVRGNNKSVGLLVGLQVIISCLVLVTCGNVVTALQREMKKPNGLQSAQVMFSTYPTVFDARYAEPAKRLRYWEDLTAAIAGKVPAAQVAFTTAPPTRPPRIAAAIETRQGAQNQGALTLPVTVVSDDYFDLMGIRLRSGRFFDSTDSKESVSVAIVDEKMATRYWPEQNAIGKRVQLNPSDSGSWLTIVGVVSAVRGAPYRPDADIGTLYQPLRQAIPPSFQVLVRLADGAADSRVTLRAAAYGVDRDLPLHNLQWLDDYLAATTMEFPAMITVFIAIAVITAVLAASGLFGLISRSVAQRTQEVGIRRALGATPWRATSMFLRQGAIYMAVAVAGLALGIMVTPLLSKAFPNILERLLPVTLGVVLLMAAVISTASYLPTRRAVALEPSDALRYE
ncbi:MAG TPA: ABC transporter permease [Thermoanaerobaculia bacterium]|nr:ABC transporter permease [Thermoanaerobaculia bacterium]